MLRKVQAGLRRAQIEQRRRAAMAAAAPTHDDVDCACLAPTHTPPTDITTATTTAHSASSVAAEAKKAAGSSSSGTDRVSESDRGTVADSATASDGASDADGGSVSPLSSTVSTRAGHSPGPRGVIAGGGAYLEGTHWTRGHVLGLGACGTVYSGIDAATGMLMAVKEVSVSVRGNSLAGNGEGDRESGSQPRNGVLFCSECCASSEVLSQFSEQATRLPKAIPTY